MQHLAARPEVSELLVAEDAPQADAPFAEPEAVPYGRVTWSNRLGRAVVDAVKSFQPDALFISSWHLRTYRTLAWEHRHTPRVLCMDNVYDGRPRQRAGVVGRAAYIKPFFDAAWVPGPAQLLFARLLGFRADQISRCRRGPCTSSVLVTSR